MDELSEEIINKLNELAEIGNDYYDQEKYDEALKVWEEALSLIPHPQQFYSQTVWFLASIGDIYFIQNNFAKAFDCFDTARGNLSGEGYGNPFVMLRLGESCLETGDERNALEYMLRAYMFEGNEIYKGEDPKYFEFLRTHIDLGQQEEEE